MPEEYEAYHRHAAYFESVVAAAASLYLQGGEKAAWALEMFDGNRENIEQAFGWCRDASLKDPAAAKLCRDFSRFGAHVLSVRLTPHHWLEWLRASHLAAASLHDRSAEGFLSRNIGLALSELGQYADAIRYYEDDLEVASEIGDRRGVGTALNNMGLAFANLTLYVEALAAYKKALQIHQKEEYVRGQLIALGNQALAFSELGRLALASRCYRRCLDLSHGAVQYLFGEATWLGNLGDVYGRMDRHKEAEEFLMKALGMSRDHGFRRNEANCLGNLALVYWAVGTPDKAIQYCTDAVEAFRRIPDARGVARREAYLGNMYAGVGELERGRQMLLEALKALKRLGDRQGYAYHSWSAGELHLRAGDIPEAQRAMAVAVAFEARIGHPDLGKHRRALERLRRSGVGLRAATVGDMSPDAA